MAHPPVTRKEILFQVTQPQRLEIHSVAYRERCSVLCLFLSKLDFTTVGWLGRLEMELEGTYKIHATPVEPPPQRTYICTFLYTDEGVWEQKLQLERS